MGDRTGGHHGGLQECAGGQRVRRPGALKRGEHVVALLTGSLLSLLLAAVSARLGRARVLAILFTLGALAPLTAALSPWAPLLLLVAAMAVFTTTAGNGILAVYATQAAPQPQRPTVIGLFSLCYQMGGAFGPAVAAMITLS
ncbi:MFS transporter [Streptomyces sp. A5-4]|uniref:MFS transporter n=1 Tax=Streptomyces sp. A5-4 TaxID=3384771 RepID=UPI003DA7EFE5